MKNVLLLDEKGIINVKTTKICFVSCLHYRSFLFRKFEFPELNDAMKPLEALLNNKKFQRKQKNSEQFSLFL